MKKALSLILTAAMVLLLLAGCGGGAVSTSDGSAGTGDAAPGAAAAPAAAGDDAPAEAEGPKVFRFGVEAEFTSMSPLVGGQVGYSTAFANGIYEPLFDMNENNEITGRLAKSYEWKDDNTLILTLQEGVKFHNGSDFTAEDVLFSLKLYYDTPQYTNRLQWIDFENSKADGDYTVELKTTSYSAVLVSNLTSELMMMLDKDWYEAAGGAIDQDANGTGPYKLKAWNMGSDLEIVRNEEYWGGADSYYDEIQIVFYNDPTTAVLEYDTGRLDAVYVQNSTDIETLLNGGFQNTWCAQAGTHTISGLCMSSFVGDTFQNPLLREAICYAIPVEELVNGVSNGIVVPQDSVIPSSDPAHKTVGYYEYDPEKATQLVEQYKSETGVTDVVLTMVNVSSTLHDDLAEAIQAYLAKVGITMQIESGQPSDIIPRYIAGEVNFCLNQSGGGADPADIFMSMERGGNPAATIPSDEVLDILDQAKVTKDWNERLELYGQVQQMVHDEYLFLPLFERQTYYAVREGITFDFGVGHYPKCTSFGAA